ncbi:MAG: hypothetical protein NC253_05045 [Ruminococcus sp.]|nr:hypothetical protein [Ruminococcus sp.]MCM1381587.1 hypothetical protein [Muribaculaceae bacterium]MCM1480267.1 hypothetical protein [Muribaculaceae bacterium]
MKKLLAIIFSLGLLAGCADNGGTAEVLETTVRETETVTSESTSVTTVTSETAAETESAAAENMPSDSARETARVFAGLVYAELENNKTAADPTVLAPVGIDREIPETGFDPDAFAADIFFIDTDFDGVPELFAGGHGTMGSGNYTVYTAGGESFGRGIFAHYLDAYCIVNGCMFAGSGSTTYNGWTKLCDNLPTVFSNGFLSEESANNMTLRYADGYERDFDGITYGEAMDMYSEYLGVEYGDLKPTGKDDEIPFAYARGVLEVPDPENYTEEDIYDCLVKLLAEYEKAAENAPEKPPVNAELGVNADGTLTETFAERIAELIEPMPRETCYIFPSLWDFDKNGVPEIILTFSHGEQGNIPCYVYNAETLEQVGEFEGFCRDGFTRFINRYDGSTVIYSYYEHSNWQRVETVEFVRLAANKLVSKDKITRSWQTGDKLANPSMVVYSDNSEDFSYEKKDYLDYNFGTVCTSYGDYNSDLAGLAATAVESYNNYITVYNIAKEDFPVNCVFIGGKNEKAVYSVRGECFFRDENGETTPLKGSMPYINIYKLSDDIIVCQPLGNTQPCDVYIMTDGKPVLDEKISGHGMLLSRSELYNGRFELIESVYDSSTGGSHTFKTYQLYRDKDGFHEYGSITVPMEDFNKYYGEAAEKILDEFQAEQNISGLEIYEVMYRGDCCFVLNCQSPIFCEEGDETPCAYRFYNFTLKPADGELSLVYWDRGIYKTALIPEIAVYPEEMYIPE